MVVLLVDTTHDRQARLGWRPVTTATLAILLEQQKRAEADAVRFSKQAEEHEQAAIVARRSEEKFLTVAAELKTIYDREEKATLAEGAAA